LKVLAGAKPLHRHLALQLLQWMQDPYQQGKAAGGPSDEAGQGAIQQLLTLMASCVGVEQPVAGSEAVHQVLQPQYCWSVPPVLYSVSTGAAATHTAVQQQQIVVSGAAQHAAAACQLHQGFATAVQHSRALPIHEAPSPAQQALQQAHVDLMRHWVQQVGATAVQVMQDAGVAPCCCEAGMPGWQLVQLLRVAAAAGCGRLAPNWQRTR
jgi:hypothetical protein